MNKGLDLNIICCGVPADWVADAINHWRKRILSLAKIDLDFIGRNKNLENTLSKRISGKYAISLTRDGKMLSSPQWAKMLEDIAISPGSATFLIGGADGLPDKIISQCNRKISLAPITIQHDVALIVLLEQLYRANAINAGLPYHRGE